MLSTFVFSQNQLTDSNQKNMVILDSVMLRPKQKPLIDSLLEYAYSYMGRNYKRGGTGTVGFDCSGYTMTVYGHFGIKLPHTSAGQALIGYEIKPSQIQKGDLIFFRGRNRKSKRIGHVGIVISTKGEPVKFIHSSTAEGVRIDRMDAPYYKVRYVKATRLITK
jgi:cell wall-associated NlpC family hydrolase